MIRITMITETDEEVVLKVEGWIEGESVSLLKAEGERYFQQTKRLELDLTGVQFIDNAGIELLKHWRGEGLVLRKVSRLVQVLLETYGVV